jgi:hypothetical protein
MATPQITSAPNSIQPANKKPTACTYCQRPISKRIVAARKPYCGKLCAALALIRSLDDDPWSAIDEEWAQDALTDLVLNAYFEETPYIPVRVRWSDAVDFGQGGNEYRLIVKDEHPCDWVPDPLEASQESIDGVVAPLLSSLEPNSPPESAQ